jgi:DnaJ-class molecular chaperone
MNYQNQNMAFNPPPDLSQAHRITCPVCAPQGIKSNLSSICGCCNGVGTVLMMPNGALFPDRMKK